MREEEGGRHGMFRMNLEDRQVTMDTAGRAVLYTGREAVQRAEGGSRGGVRRGQHRCRM